MSGGSYVGVTPQGIVAAGVAYNPNYGKMAADSIAKEVEERRLVVAAAAAPEEIADGEQPAPATGADGIAPGEVRSAGACG